MVTKMRRVFFTYSRTGRITRHRFLRAAILIAQAQALEGRDAYVDQFDGKFTRNVRFFPGKRILKRLKNLKKPMRKRHPQKRSTTSRRKRR